jgi:hypothetical protein
LAGREDKIVDWVSLWFFRCRTNSYPEKYSSKKTKASKRGKGESVNQSATTMEGRMDLLGKF